MTVAGGIIRQKALTRSIMIIPNVRIKKIALKKVISHIDQHIDMRI